jgi:rod shape-determining protein MreC
MRNLFTFLWRNHVFFLFILLEVISGLLIVNNHNFQHSVVINHLSEFSGSLHQSVSNINDYFHLKEANRKLAEENARLRALLPTSMIIKDTNSFLKKDTIYKQQYTFTAAKVISNSVTGRNNYIMLNKGTSDGIKADMAVIAPNGIVGIISKVSSNFSWVISVLHKQTKISAKIKKNGFVGTIVWDGTDYKTGHLKDIPANVLIAKGDTVITSGYSHIFPQGIMVGLIKDYKVDKGYNFYDIEITFSQDYNKLSYVYIVTNFMKEEQNTLQKFTVDE